MKVPKKTTYKDNRNRDREDFINMNDESTTNATSDVTLMTVQPGEFSKVVSQKSR